MYTLSIILGSTRPNRTSEKVLPWLQAELARHPDFTSKVLDLRDYDLPFYDQPTSPSSVKDGAYPNEVARELAKKIKDSDAFLVIAPEYNHGYSAVLKNAFDTVYTEWNNKPIAFVSYGSVGGARSVEQLRQVAIELQMAPIRNGVHIPAPWSLVDEGDKIKAGALDPYTKPLENLLTQLLWWSEALHSARQTTKQH